ncbi:hypothetical protein CK203_040676 [Vitis vinifera]|uniref:Integrase catalytic domain-containing protein n=1 Tax=Vitis vinifera TaxID=29760 RepID=A0A438HIZ7_VITVI|nr:hypothetical protein CK203_040676 [Vitis vinifera]
MHEIVEYLRTRELPGDEKHAHKIRVQVARPTLIDDSLYIWYFRGSYLKCLSDPEARYVIAELHEDVCGNHADKCTLAHRAHTQGMDIVGHLPVVAAQKKFLLIAIDYFNKWVEAEAYARIKDKDVSKFVWKNIVYRNGQVEATNKTLLTMLKKKLEEAKGKWVDELPGVLWTYRTTSRRPTGTTPFVFAYEIRRKTCNPPTFGTCPPVPHFKQQTPLGVPSSPSSAARFPVRLSYT